MEIKSIIAGTYENDYNGNIQMQFNSDNKFTAFMEMLSNYGTEYQNSLIKFGDLYNLNNEELLSNTYVLNSIGYVLNLPPLSSFPNITAEQYLFIVKGQLVKNQWDGTNAGMLSILQEIFPEFQFILEDTGIMQIKISLIPLTTIDSVTQQLFEDGYFTPKPAGVSVELSVADNIYFAWNVDYQEGPPQLGKWGVGVW